MHVQFDWCYSAFLYCMYVTVTHIAKYADSVKSDQQYNPEYGMLSLFYIPCTFQPSVFI